MRDYTTDAIRNLCVVAHAGAGKTSLIEAMLYSSGAIARMGRVEDGTTVSDFDPDEVSRRTTLAATPCIAEWREHKLNLIDSPGYEDFYGELESALRVADAAIIVVDAVQGVAGGTEKVWAAAERHNLPRAIVVNHLDGEDADYDKVLASVQDLLGVQPVRVTLPVGAGSSLTGVVDLLAMRGVQLAADGKTAEVGDIPADVEGAAEEAREALIEAAAEGEDSLTEKYLEGEELSAEEVAEGLRAAFRERVAIPAFAVSAIKNVGVSVLLDFIVDCFPSPADVPVPATLSGEEVTLTADASGPLAVLVFKTVTDPFSGRLNLFRVYSGTLGVESVQNTSRGEAERISKVNHPSGKQQIEAKQIVAGDIGTVVKLAASGTGDTLARPDKPYVLAPVSFPAPTLSLAVFPMTEGDDDRLIAGITRIADEDPSFHVSRNNDTKETIISGLGEQHLTVSLERAKRKFNVNARTAAPKIAYRETFAKAVKGVEYTHKKQTGGSGQYARIVVDVEPLPRGGGYEFVDKIFGGAIDQQYRPSVDKGMQASMTEGVLCGFPVVDLRVSLVDGKTHPVDSKDIAFQIAGREGFKKAAEMAGIVLLEPVMNLEILVPEDSMGDVIGDLNGRRGHVMGMDQVNNRQLIRAEVPLAEMSRYHTDLRAMTRARGTFTMTLSHYAEVPREAQEKIVTAIKQG
ncbi:elongation factor G [Candidatus Poribacteria bacterium]|nr:elongation factor G [Candidatus Poribacteria bacterium]